MTERTKHIEIYLVQMYLMRPERLGKTTCKTEEKLIQRDSNLLKMQEITTYCVCCLLSPCSWHKSMAYFYYYILLEFCVLFLNSQLTGQNLNSILPIRSGSAITNKPVLWLVQNMSRQLDKIVTLKTARMHSCTFTTVAEAVKILAMMLLFLFFCSRNLFFFFRTQPCTFRKWIVFSPFFYGSFFCAVYIQSSSNTTRQEGGFLKPR